MPVSGYPTTLDITHKATALGLEKGDLLGMSHQRLCGGQKRPSAPTCRCGYLPSDFSRSSTSFATIFSKMANSPLAPSSKYPATLFSTYLPTWSTSTLTSSPAFLLAVITFSCVYAINMTSQKPSGPSSTLVTVRLAPSIVT